MRAEATQEVSLETADASHSHIELETKERVPLGEVSGNSPVKPELENAEVKKMPAKKGKAKGGAKKGAKGKRAKAAEEEQVEDEVIVVLEDERQAAGSPASDAAVDELAKEPTEGACSGIAMRAVIGDSS